MTWLARIHLEYDVLARLCIWDCYDWHKKAWELFPGRPKGHRRPFLFRVIDENEGCDLWLMCSEEPTRPDWAESRNWKLSFIRENFPFHRYYRFDLLANSARRDKERDTWNGRESKRRRFNLRTPEEHEVWLLRKATEHGFRIVSDSRNGPSIDFDTRRDYSFVYREKFSGLHVGTRYRGLLEVVDRQKFAAAFKHGIGSAKSFGFGLLLLKPVITID